MYFLLSWKKPFRCPVSSQMSDWCAISPRLGIQPQIPWENNHKLLKVILMFPLWETMCPCWDNPFNLKWIIQTEVIEPIILMFYVNLKNSLCLCLYICKIINAVNRKLHIRMPNNLILWLQWKYLSRWTFYFNVSFKKLWNLITVYMYIIITLIRLI